MVWPTLGSRTAKEQNRTRLSRYQKGKTNLDFTEARDSEWQWHQLGQVCTSLQSDSHASNPAISFFTGRMPFLPPNQQRLPLSVIDKSQLQGLSVAFGTRQLLGVRCTVLTFVGIMFAQHRAQKYYSAAKELIYIWPNEPVV